MNILLKNVSVIQPHLKKTIENTSVALKDGKIDRIGEIEETTNFDKVIDCTGKYVIPGLIDAHVHLYGCGVDEMSLSLIYAENRYKKFKRNCKQQIESGVTTIREMPGSFSDKIGDYINNANNEGALIPNVYFSGQAISASFGYFSVKYFIQIPSDFIRGIFAKIYRLNGLSVDIEEPAQAKEIVDNLYKQNVSFIKTTGIGKPFPFEVTAEEQKKYRIPNEILNSEGISSEMLSAIVDAAHDRNLKVVCHNIYSNEDFKNTALAKVDSIEHNPFDEVSVETFKILSKNNTYWTPTLYTALNMYKLLNNIEEFENEMFKTLIPEPYYSKGRKILEYKIKDIKDGGFEKKFYNEIEKYINNEIHKKNVANAVEADVVIVAGSDSGAGGISYLPHGCLYKEIETLNNCGLDNYEALKTATCNAADAIGNPSIGYLEEGKNADLVILNDDPIKNITALTQIKYVLKDGEVVVEK